FDYTVSDGLGGVALASVSVAVLPKTSPVINRIAGVALAPDRVGIRFHGLPGSTYLLERSENLRDWTVVTEAFAPANGTVNLEDMNPPQATAFYRTRVR
ncbi:MAG: hypothetical protein ACREUU_05355, partial [Gammaproteobacteria bacterium]